MKEMHVVLRGKRDYLPGLRSLCCRHNLYCCWYWQFRLGTNICWIYSSSWNLKWNKVLMLTSFVFCLSKIMVIMCVPNTSALSAYLNEFMALIFWLRSWTRMVIEFHTFNTYLWFQQIFKDLQNFIISWDLNICQLWGELQSWCCLHAQTCKKYKKSFYSDWIF